MKGTRFSPIVVAQALMRRRRRFSSAVGLLATATLVLFLAACAGPAQSTATSGTATAQGAVVPVTSVSEQDELAGQKSSGDSPNSYLIKVYFSKSDEPDVSAVFAVNRFSPTLAVATFAIQSLIAGPTLAESDAGYFTQLNSFFAGPSTCKGFRDFSLSLNKKGTTPEQGTVTVQFCRPTLSPGEGADGQILAEIRTTLKQFSNIKNVVVLLQNGHCFGDESGMDACLK